MSVCFTPQGCLLEAVDSVWSGFADTVRTAAGQMLTALFGWWTVTPSMSVDAAVTHSAQTFVGTAPGSVDSVGVVSQAAVAAW